MPVIASIAPIPPITPSVSVAICRKQNCGHFVDTGSQGSQASQHPTGATCSVSPAPVAADRGWSAPPAKLCPRAIAGSGETSPHADLRSRLAYFPSSTMPTTCTRVPSGILKYPPIAFSTEPKILRANSRFTTATRGEFLSSCQVKSGRTATCAFRVQDSREKCGTDRHW